jgi:hypothetical protein
MRDVRTKFLFRLLLRVAQKWSRVVAVNLMPGLNCHTAATAATDKLQFMT